MLRQVLLSSRGHIDASSNVTGCAMATRCPCACGEVRVGTLLCHQQSLLAPAHNIPSFKGVDTLLSPDVHWYECVRKYDEVAQPTTGYLSAPSCSDADTYGSHYDAVGQVKCLRKPAELLTDPLSA